MQYFDQSLAEQTFAATALSLRSEVDAAEPRLRALSEAEASSPLAPTKWSPKQVLGHLIDSAANNHQRFVRAQATAELRLPGYGQESWVATQHYTLRAWTDLIELWSAYNRHLAHVIAHIPEDMRKVRCLIGDNPAVPLSHVALDYVGHLQHHLRQIFHQS